VYTERALSLAAPPEDWNRVVPRFTELARVGRDQWRSPMHRTRLMALAVMLALTLALPTLAPRAARSQTDNLARLEFADLITSTVQAYACDALRVSEGPVSLTDFHNQRGSCWGGSGTVIRPDGVILTNAHVALDQTQTEPLWVLIRQTISDRTLPQDAFIGRPVLYSAAYPHQSFAQPDEAYLDLAVVVPAFTLDGTPIQPGEVTLRPLPMAEAESVGIGDPLHNIGYPGVGGDLITVTQGAVSGFEPDPMVPQLGLVAWIKSDSTIGGGISGGTTINADGFQIGVPTEFGETEQREGLGTVSVISHMRPVPEGYNLLLEMGEGEGIPEPVEGTNTEGDVTITGSIVSADTGQPIGGAWFIVLKPGVPVQEFLDGNQEAVYSFVTSGANGEFQLKSPVVRDQAYGVLVIARGYLNMSEDNRVLATADSPAVVTLPPIEMGVQR
jgi:S1-C subfamily serine protease